MGTTPANSCRWQIHMPSLHRHPSPSPISPKETNLYSKGLSKQFRVLPVSELYDKVSSACNTLMPISISSLIQIIFLPTKQGTSAGAGLHVSSQATPPPGGHNPLSQGKWRVRKPSGLSSSQQVFALAIPPMTAKKNQRVTEYFHLKSAHSDFF